MKNIIITVIMIGVMMLTAGCSNMSDKETQMTTAATAKSTTSVTEDRTDSTFSIPNGDVENAEDVANFAQVISFIIGDEKYDVHTIDYEICLYRVAASETDMTQLAVISRCTNNNSGNELFAPMAAASDYLSPTTGEIVESKKVWYNLGTPYSAESIIEVSVAKARDLGYDPDELELNECIILTSTY